MRICLVHRDLHAITRGGIGTVYAELATRLRSAGHTVTLLTQQTPCPLELAEITTLTLPRTDDLGAHRRAVDEVLTALEPDVVDSSTWEAETLHYLRRPRAQRAPVVVRGEFSAATMHATNLIDAERELVHRADALLAVSDFAASDLAKTYGVPMPAIVPNGVDRARFQPGPVRPPTTGHRLTLDTHGNVRTRTPLMERSIDQLPPPWNTPDSRPRLVWVGKITPMKGWDRLEHIVGCLRHRMHLTVLLGHSRPFCPTALSGDDDVTILQDLSSQDLVSLYRAADWLLSTSRWEGFGLAIAEALACGTPVLLPTDLATAAELLADTGGRTYVDATDLAAILDEANPLLGCLPARFAWDRNVAATVDIYRAATGTAWTR